MKSAVLRVMFPMTLSWKIDRAIRQVVTPTKAVEAFTAAYLATLKGEQ